MKKLTLIASIVLFIGLPVSLARDLESQWNDQVNKESEEQRICKEKWDKAQFQANLKREPGHRRSSFPTQLTKNTRFFIGKNDVIWAVLNEPFECYSQGFGALNKEVKLGQYKALVRIDRQLGKLIVLRQFVPSKYQVMETGPVEQEIIMIKEIKP